ncbi:GyrI-like domain-containing protein [Bacillus atrophaeus]|uniref:GyrI-like domain-containing protein n=1 Tax=Bacillus atrophaeus TaxID=1452 RepID=UPI002DB9D6E6|nr:GyrI-like domain-containing protein [Bacillus atrophaeus]MEC1901863.1 GyrI-like domain-containing protein [Bacillus atrophaeus]MEC2398692.1 GyrI-like domain-containing protein [Bacillus atrophaeus]MED4436882.1 GyrI-like domain-containing protein [Bacillus atrophaeus]MED4563752.1 GyrI-like domain-containing protein [Bacillus atrophaeus]MED4573914.1 GyrI-like domain-containing protein [Bacillus atrophaeus]
MSFSHYVQMEQQHFIGMSVRTSNALEMSSEGKIPRLWNSFWQENPQGILAEPPEDKKIITLYSDYEQKEHGMYTFSIGTFTNQARKVHEPFKENTLPSSAYAVFSSRTGPIDEVVLETWKEIWSWEKRHLRTFSGDFEVYDQGAVAFGQAKVKIYIAVNLS